MISIHALREEGDSRSELVYSIMGISIHALREEGDTSASWRWASSTAFLSTPSARRATTGYCSRWSHCHISIHALREEGDMSFLSSMLSNAIFLSTPSARRATLIQHG